MTVAGEDRANHCGIALAPSIGPQLGDTLLSSRDFGRAITFVGEGGENDSLNALRLRLRVSGGPDAARRRAEEVQLLPTAFLRNHGYCCFEILDAASDVRVVPRTAGIAVAVVVHSPYVIASEGQYIHQRILVVTRHNKVIG